MVGFSVGILFKQIHYSRVLSPKSSSLGQSHSQPDRSCVHMGASSYTHLSSPFGSGDKKKPPVSCTGSFLGPFDLPHQARHPPSRAPCRRHSRLHRSPPSRGRNSGCCWVRLSSQVQLCRASLGAFARGEPDAECSHQSSFEAGKKRTEAGNLHQILRWHLV